MTTVELGTIEVGRDCRYHLTRVVQHDGGTIIQLSQTNAFERSHAFRVPRPLDGPEGTDQ